MSGRNGYAPERRNRSTGELYDAIWAAELPPIMDERDERAAAVAESVARLVLMAMAKFTNPNRDQIHGPARTWQCYASVATIAELANASERQVQRVLRTFEGAGYIDRIAQGRRPGRPRTGEEPARARPSTWCLRPELWPPRTLRNRAGLDVISDARRKSLPAPEEVASAPARLRGNRVEAGPGSMEIGPVSSPEPGSPGTHRDEELVLERSRARARGESIEKTNDLEGVVGHDVALPGFGATRVPGLPGNVETPTDRPRDEASCPDCGRAVTADGRGHHPVCRARGRGAKAEPCPACGERVDRLTPDRWHLRTCRLHQAGRDHPDHWTEDAIQVDRDGSGSAPPNGTELLGASAVDQVAEREAGPLEHAPVQRSAEDQALLEQLQANLEQVRAAEGIKVASA